MPRLARRIARILAPVVVGAGVAILPVALLLGPSNETDGFRLFLGKNQDELVARGAREYPGETQAHNRRCHRLAARLTAERYGVVTALAAGVANELAESTALTLMGQNPLSQGNIDETLGDLSANWRGVKDSMGDAFGHPRAVAPATAGTGS